MRQGRGGRHRRREDFGLVEAPLPDPARMEGNRGHQVGLGRLAGKRPGEPSAEAPRQRGLAVELDPVDRHPEGSVVNPHGAAPIEGAAGVTALVAKKQARRCGILEGEYRLAAAAAAGPFQESERPPAREADAAVMLGGKRAPADQAVGRQQDGGQWQQEPPDYV